MENATKVGVAVAAGYLLGRSKKAKLAVTMGTWMMGRRFNFDLKGIAREGLAQLASSQEVSKLAEEIRRDLFAAARAAATTAATGRIDKLTDALHDRTEGLRERPGEGADSGPEGESEGADSGPEDESEGADSGPDGESEGENSEGEDEGRVEKEKPERMKHQSGNEPARQPGPRRSAPPRSESGGKEHLGRRRPTPDGSQPQRPPRKRAGSTPSSKDSASQPPGTPRARKRGPTHRQTHSDG